MDLRIHSDNWGELLLTNNSTHSRKNLIFPGAKLQIAESSRNGYIYLIQQFDLKFFTIRYCCFSSILKDVITITTSTPKITFRLGASRSHTMLSKHFGNQVFHERGYNFFYDPGTTTQYPIGPDEHYIFLDLVLKKDYALYLEYCFPETIELFEKAFVRTPAKMTMHNQVAKTEVWRWQQELEGWCFDKNRKKEHGNIIAHRLVEQSIKSIRPAQGERGIKLNQQEINRICDIAEMISQSEKTYSLKTLASLTHIKRQRLQAGFKQIFGHPITKHKFEEKMLMALRYSNAKDATIEFIAAQLGYKDPNKFANDFVNRFGYSPLQQGEKAEKS